MTANWGGGGEGIVVRAELERSLKKSPQQFKNKIMVTQTRVPTPEVESR